jgi:hypothetical protein
MRSKRDEGRVVMDKEAQAEEQVEDDLEVSEQESEKVKGGTGPVRLDPTP